MSQGYAAIKSGDNCLNELTTGFLMVAKALTTLAHSINIGEKRPLKLR
jgi:hypothetical protein